MESLKGPLWCRLHALLGPGGDLIIIDMLLDCGIFSPVEGSRGNYLRISSVPLSELKPKPVPSDAACFSERKSKTECNPLRSKPHALCTSSS